MSESDTSANRDASSDWHGLTRLLGVPACVQLFDAAHNEHNLRRMVSQPPSAPPPRRTSACGWPLEYPKSVWSFESVLRTAEAESETEADAEADTDAVARPDVPKRVVSSLCSFFGCAFLRKCLPTFSFIINFKKLLMAATRCPKMAEWRTPSNPFWPRICVCICVCVGQNCQSALLISPRPFPCSAAWSLKLLIGLPTCTAHSPWVRVAAGLKWIRIWNPLEEPFEVAN